MNLAEELSLASHAIDISASTQLGGEVLVEAPFKVFSNVALFTFRGGAFSYVSPASRLHRVQLGRYCSIGDDVRILSSHPTDGLTTSPFPYQRLFLSPFNARPQVRFSNLSDTVIGNDVWVGSGVRIKSGVTIGDGAIVGAGSLITRDVPAYTVVAGIPARSLRMRFDESTQKRLTALAWWRYNLVGLELPWGDLSSLIYTVEKMVAEKSLVPYMPELFALWREEQSIKTRRIPRP